MKAQGTVHKYADNVDTDVIIPARYLNTPNAKELATHCMEDIDPDFVKNVKEGDIMVAGWNFGCGSSREHAPLAIKTSGVSCVIAKTFARIFYRNAINRGGGGLRHRRHHQRHQGRELPGPALPALHPEHHSKRRPDEGHQGIRGRKRWKRKLQ